MTNKRCNDISAFIVITDEFRFCGMDKSVVIIKKLASYLKKWSKKWVAGKSRPLHHSISIGCFKWFYQLPYPAQIENNLNIITHENKEIIRLKDKIKISLDTLESLKKIIKVQSHELNILRLSYRLSSDDFRSYFIYISEK
jgi:hypothetical protein